MTTYGATRGSGVIWLTTFVFGVIHMNCEMISNGVAFKLLNELKLIAYMEFSECVRLYT